jgi:cell division transport system ATP-binding protein
VAIGRALINNPPLLLADEPTGNLDPQHSWEIMELLLQLNKRGTTVLVASHDMMIVERVGRRIVTLGRGRIASDVRVEESELDLFQEDVAAVEDTSPAFQGEALEDIDA